MTVSEKKNMTVGEVVSYKCKRCEKEFTDAWDLIDHLYFIHDIPVMCERTTTTTEGF